MGMEARVGAHHLSRKLQMLGHDARLMPGKYVRLDSRGQKKDFRRRSHRWDCPTPDHEIRRNQDRRSARPSGTAPRPRSIGQRTSVINQIRV